MYRIYELEDLDINGVCGFLLKNPRFYCYIDGEHVDFDTQFDNLKDAEEEIAKFKIAKNNYLTEEYTILKIYR